MADSPIKYVSFDPGYHTGWAYWDVHGNFLEMNTCHGFESLHHRLEITPMSIVAFIYEGFNLRSDLALVQAGSDMPACIAIGMIMEAGMQRNTDLVNQPASIKNVAEKWGVPTTGMSHDRTHVLSAYNHGVYYFVQQGIKQVDLRGLKL